MPSSWLDLSGFPPKGSVNRAWLAEAEPCQSDSAVEDARECFDSVVIVRLNLDKETHRADHSLQCLQNQQVGFPEQDPPVLFFVVDLVAGSCCRQLLSLSFPSQVSCSQDHSPSKTPEKDEGDDNPKEYVIEHCQQAHCCTTSDRESVTSIEISGVLLLRTSNQSTCVLPPCDNCYKY
jgi:hypothetical protein